MLSISCLVTLSVKSLFSLLSTDKLMKPVQPLRSLEPRSAAEKIDRYILGDGRAARAGERMAVLISTQCHHSPELVMGKVLLTCSVCVFFP